MRLALFTLLLLPLTLHAAPATLPIAADGKALVPVVISPKASESTKAAAEELAAYLGRIASAKFDVATGDGAKGIVLGTIAEFPNPSLSEGLAIRNVYDGKEAFAIRTEPERVLLIGATDLAVPHASSRLLESLGCRWFFPAREWEVVPSTKSLSVSLEVTDRPKVLARRIWYGYGPFYDRAHPEGKGHSTLTDYQDWARHNRMAGSFKVNAGHAWQAIILENQKTFDAHPEYLALVKGQRRKPQLCVSNPEVQKLAIAHALKRIEEKPQNEMVSMECSDGLNHCECENCKKLGSVSDRVFGLANIVAKEVNTKHPGKMVGVLAYSDHSEPPSFELEPNVYVQLTGGFTHGQYTHDELVELWPKKCKNLGFYEYFSVWLWDFDRLPGGKGANLTLIKERLDRFVKAGATSFDAESGNNWGVHGRGYYVTNRLLWDPNADVKAILDDFYAKAFGPGAAAMKRYYERVAPDSGNFMSRGTIGEAFRDVEEAARLAKDQPDVLARIDHIKHYLRYVHLRWLIDHEADAAKKKDLTIAALTLCYRTRYSYMNHWAAMRYTWAGDAAKDFNEPTWAFGDKSKKPWLNETPVSREEIDRAFAEGLAYFVPTPATEITFEGDLVPVALPKVPVVGKPMVPLPKVLALKQAFQAPATYALHSKKSEPFVLDITTGVIVGYRDKADASYTLKDAAGKVVAEGRLKLDGEIHKVEMKVPGPGTYIFEFRDSGAAWRITAEPGLAAVLLNNKARKYNHSGLMQETYFYVPKGTKGLQFYWHGGPLKLVGPDRKVIAEVAVTDEVVTVPVPAGLDGTAWSFAPHGRHGWLWFFNAPNVLGVSPETMLVPRELAKKDGIAK